MGKIGDKQTDSRKEGIWFNSFKCLASKGRKGRSSLVSCTAVCPIPVPSPVHQSVPSPVAAPVQQSSGHQSTFALPPPPPGLLSLPPWPDPGYILTLRGLTLAMSRTGQDGGHLILTRQMSSKPQWGRTIVQNCPNITILPKMHFSLIRGYFLLLKNQKSNTHIHDYFLLLKSQKSSTRIHD